jgi:hypothetical protein
MLDASELEDNDTDEAEDLLLFEHQVRNGESLNLIARRFGIDLSKTVRSASAPTRMRPLRSRAGTKPSWAITVPPRLR